jgi:hypothetical protein
VRVAVNISPIHFRQSKFLDIVRAALLEHDLEPQYLKIELTETIVMDHAENSVSILEELSRTGVIASIDDFVCDSRPSPKRWKHPISYNGCENWIAISLRAFTAAPRYFRVKSVIS